MNREIASFLTLPDARRMPRLGQGTWHMAERPDRRGDEIAALRRGVEMGMTLIDTAEMYAGGGAETLTGQAVEELPREDLFIVSKVYPHNAGRDRIFRSCENSLSRLKTDYLDLYLLHWRGSVPLEETAACMQELTARGLIRGWGVSNFDAADMRELWSTPQGRYCLVNQVLYHLGSRGIEVDLLPWQRERNIPVMAYCPLAQGGRLRRGLLTHPAVTGMTEKYGATPSQILLAFLLHDPLCVAIPKAGAAVHAEENARALTISLSEEDYMLLSRHFPAPTHKVPLDMQ